MNNAHPKTRHHHLLVALFLIIPVVILITQFYRNPVLIIIICVVLIAVGAWELHFSLAHKAYRRAVVSGVCLIVVSIVLVMEMVLALPGILIPGWSSFQDASVTNSSKIQFAEGLNSNITCFAYNNSNGKLYVGTEKGDVFVQKDEKTWSDTGNPGKTSISSIIYNSNDTSIYIANKEGRISRYDGNKWTVVGSLDGPVYQLCPGNGNVGLLALYGPEVTGKKISRYEGGTTWSDVSFTDDPYYLFYDPSESRLYVGCVYGSSQGDLIFRFEGNGWNGMGLKESNTVYSMVYNERDSKLYAGLVGQVYRCDSDETWTNTMLSEKNQVFLKGMVYNPNDQKIYAAADNHLYSFDGEKWLQLGGCFSWFDCLTYNPADQRIYMAGPGFYMIYDGKRISEFIF